MMDNEKTQLVVKTNPITDDYTVVWDGKLGCGITGPVRPCKCKKTNDVFALKCLLDGPRSRQEINLHHKCQDHENIISIYAVYSNNMRFPREENSKSRLLVVMEMMEGGELFDNIKRLKFFSEKMAVRYTMQICKAIQHCHLNNVAHRDLKPENLLLKNASDGAPIKLADFGFAKLDEGNLITPNFTPYFAAPQVLQALKNKQKIKSCFHPSSSPICYDKSCDMWSLGVIVYIMICGYPPFYSENPNTQLSKRMKERIMAGTYDFPDDDWSFVSNHAKDFVARLLQVDPTSRMTIEEAIIHPWLLIHPSIHNLPSPAILSNQTSMCHVNEAHENHLVTIRSSDLPIRLKPFSKIKSSILNKRLSHSKTLKNNITENNNNKNNNNLNNANNNNNNNNNLNNANNNVNNNNNNNNNNNDITTNNESKTTTST